MTSVSLLELTLDRSNFKTDEGNDSVVGGGSRRTCSIFSNDRAVLRVRTGFAALVNKSYKSGGLDVCADTNAGRWAN